MTQETTTEDRAVHFERDRGVTSIVTARGIAHVTVSWQNGIGVSGRLELLRVLAADSVSLFLIKLQPHGISFAVRPDHVEKCVAVLEDRGCDYRILRDLGLVSTYAGAMRDLSGVMARIYHAMVEAEVRVQQTGDAYNAVHCLVAGDEADRAAVALRREFILQDLENERYSTAAIWA